MTKRILTTTAALTFAIAGAAYAQDGDETNDMSVTNQAAQVGEEVVDTGQAAAQQTVDAAQGVANAAGNAAGEAYGAASNVSAQLDAALTEDAVVRSSDGEIIGTIYRTDLDGDRVLIDVDGELENTIDRDGIENAAVSVSSLMVGNESLMLDMTAAEFATALETGPIATSRR
ncbi:hypothetical protein OCH239_05810 [Roseivivax halodurans JCM 10272]|uniref:PRC-barrel domain-containing protein n=1 Tax=Roseivivax halodurans JCM 10272 TaxID=1449350 RepID=X7EFM6_9RHOB|nr:hypothetical protein [Roseivivax halodurans]ETX14021.1 hypothetical protein OCH239_05810 [Roseivivax halodurans JCM 10272]